MSCLPVFINRQQPQNFAGFKSCPLLMNCQRVHVVSATKQCQCVTALSGAARIWLRSSWASSSSSSSPTTALQQSAEHHHVQHCTNIEARGIMQFRVMPHATTAQMTAACRTQAGPAQPSSAATQPRLCRRTCCLLEPHTTQGPAAPPQTADEPITNKGVSVHPMSERNVHKDATSEDTCCSVRMDE